MKVMRSNIFAAILILILAASIATIKQAATNSTHSATSTLAEREDDKLYLRGFAHNNLTTAEPTSATAATIEVPTGGSVTKIWVNETVVPDGYNWIISVGTYTFYFWMEKTGGNVSATLTFRFGYIKKDGAIVTPIDGTGTFRLRGQPDTYSISVNGSSVVTIPSGSRLFINVTISASGTPGKSAVFYYNGTRQQTRIETPSISQVSAPGVPEFPLGVVFLPPAMLLVYFIFKRRFVRFRV